MQNVPSASTYFYTIVANYNGPLAADLARVDGAAHMQAAKDEAKSMLTLTLIRLYEDVASRPHV